MVTLDGFMLGFNKKDLEAVSVTLNYPHVRFASGTVTVWDSAEEFAQTDFKEYVFTTRIFLIVLPTDLADKPIL